MKRARGDTLTGGSRDVNPQEFVFPILIQGGADTTKNVVQPLPIPRLPTREGKNLVIEILWVEFNFIIAGVAAATQSLYMNITTDPNTPATIPDALQGTRNIAEYYMIYSYSAGASIVYPMNKEVDLTDGAGHGILVATDQLYANIMSTNTNAANQGVIRFGYRFKEVSLVEYIGIVQSQQ